MAKQTGPVIWEKTIDPVSFYKRCGVGCVRMKSNLTAERWRSDPVFAGSRKSAARLALAAKLASAFYQTIPEQHRKYSHYKQLVGVAQHMLCKGYDIQQVNKVLHFTISRYLRKLEAADPNRKPIRSSFAATLSLNTKPVFTKLVLHQLVMPQSPNITVSQSPFRSWLIIQPPRGSPMATAGCTQKTETLTASACHLCCGTPVTTSHSNGRTCYVHTCQTGLLYSSKQPPKHQENTPGNNFLPFNFL
ncbi:hypothetical protein [Filimonas effusa]|uniref:Uncharacterized protein n=1 Tax=Filimonas effusa TaxID=2508721 RepID=A0A4Q1DBQ7_9BACT|nr:hypothetical protein [Filimonas effusa]RXK85949.1 hypothetical protein ESB13_03830 [Filimonas effusa]